MAATAEDPTLGSGPDEDYDSPSGDGSDSDSILSDDSVLPDYIPEVSNRRTASTLYRACACNDGDALRRILERGVMRDEVMEADVNGQNGLMAACSKGFMSIVHGLHGCPFIDINQQDNEGNTALMIAAQAGHISTVMYLLNYFSGIDTEIKDCRGFTALIKAAMTGRTDVVAVLVMAGADLRAVDTTKGKHAQDWALKTGRYETLQRLRRLETSPKAEQFCESYVPEWPELKERVARAIERKSATEKTTQCVKNTFGFRFPHDPEDNGCMDHMVRITTGVHSYLVSTGCRPLCPTSPPEVGKPRLTVPELVKKYPDTELEKSSVCQWNLSASHTDPSAQAAERGPAACAETADRRSLLSKACTKIAATFIPRSLARRNSVFPSGCIPTISVRGPSEAAPKKEKKRKTMDKRFLEPPKWKYKESRI
ncbi:Ankyrin repeat domain-containing protein 33B [Takifugu flavidus]|uniref:Ankyrin repeat domain-containing protein 33B n=1 Tax=Takifugu flavidus TaxID=433684 RepID=A0A5C6N4Z8_9TELE|nr:Ankyrin repeat domain-containing protein 33B [Takifugu flavidus]